MKASNIFYAGCVPAVEKHCLPHIHTWGVTESLSDVSSRMSEDNSFGQTLDVTPVTWGSKQNIWMFQIVVVSRKPFQTERERVGKACFNIETFRRWNEYLKIGEKKDFFFSRLSDVFSVLFCIFNRNGANIDTPKKKFWIFHSSSFSDTRHNAFLTIDKRKGRLFLDKHFNKEWRIERFQISKQTNKTS